MGRERELSHDAYAVRDVKKRDCNEGQGFESGIEGTRGECETRPEVTEAA